MEQNKKKMPPTGFLTNIGHTIHYTGKCFYCNENYEYNTAWEWRKCLHITCDLCQEGHNTCIMCKDPEKKLRKNDSYVPFLLIICSFIFSLWW